MCDTALPLWLIPGLDEAQTHGLQLGLVLRRLPLIKLLDPRLKEKRGDGQSMYGNESSLLFERVIVVWDVGQPEGPGFRFNSLPAPLMAVCTPSMDYDRCPHT